MAKNPQRLGRISDQIQKDLSLQQAVNVATLPGIVGYALAMPDIHEGYGFPIGGVAAFDLDVEHLALPHAGDAGYAERFQRAFNRFALWVQHAVFKSDGNAGFHGQPFNKSRDQKRGKTKAT